MQQLRDKTRFVPEVLEDGRNRVYILLLIERSVLVAILCAIPLPARNEAAAAIALAELNTHVTESIGERLLKRIQKLLLCSSALMIVTPHLVVRLSASQGINRHPGACAR